MAEYTSTREGFQRAMRNTLNGRPEDSKAFAESLARPDFYQVINGERVEYDAYVDRLVEWREKTSDYNPKMDGDQLAARLSGTVQVEGKSWKVEAFLFGKVHASGRMEYLV